MNGIGGIYDNLTNPTMLWGGAQAGYYPPVETLQERLEKSIGIFKSNSTKAEAALECLKQNPGLAELLKFNATGGF